MNAFMDAFRRLASLALGMSTLLAYAGPSVQDGLQANTLERVQRENEFHVRLYDAPIPQPSAGPRLPLPLETAPRSTLHLSQPLPPNPTKDTQVVPQTPSSGEPARQDLTQQQRL